MCVGNIIMPRLAMPRGAHKAIKPHNPFVGVGGEEGQQQVASRNLQNDSLFGSALSTILRIMLGIRFATTLINYLRAGNKPTGIGKIMAKIESRHAVLPGREGEPERSRSLYAAGNPKIISRQAGKSHIARLFA